MDQHQEGAPDWHAAGPGGRPPEALVAYRRGHVMFMAVRVQVSLGVLVPRSHTELWGQAVLRFLAAEQVGRRPDEPVRLIDMCCGSGNLACALAVAIPPAVVWASDLTDQCVALTRQNVEALGLRDRVRVFQGDLFAPLAGESLEGLADAVVCNPPYIPNHLLAARDDLRHEPREAFAGGPYGVSLITRVLREAPAFLRPGGRLFLEVGPRDDRHALGLFARFGCYDDVAVIRDHDGVVIAVHGRKAAR
jgi:release factor glutamine methyltransferase